MKQHALDSSLPERKKLAQAVGVAALAFSTSASAQQADPLAASQWHLYNSGQAVQADTRPVAGVDPEVDQPQRHGIRGAGAVIAIVDDGLQIHHPDLAVNIAPVAGSPMLRPFAVPPSSPAAGW